ncbi:hypothetical protein [Paenibacillus sp. SI8]|uniref:hypothetical protein n=1 Tax=unclassified Paenibacillus TaxID=185978 RepID=UPI0034652D86
MNKKLRIIILALTVAALLFGGWTAFAATTSNPPISVSVQGTLKAIAADGTQVTVTTNGSDQTIPLAKSVWVYRNEQKALLPDLKPGDTVELILNNKQQAAYVKASTGEIANSEPASSTAAASPVPSPTPASTEASEPQASTQATISPSPSASAVPPSSSQQVKEVYPGLDGMDLKIDGKHFKLHMQQVPGNSGMNYDLNIKPEGAGMVHLKGDEAAAWIKELLSSVNLKSSDAEQQLLKELAEHYQLDAKKLNIQMKASWKQGENSKQEKGQGRGQDQDQDQNQDQGQDHNQNQGQTNTDKEEHTNSAKKGDKLEKSESHKKNEKQQHRDKHDD